MPRIHRDRTARRQRFFPGLGIAARRARSRATASSPLARASLVRRPARLVAALGLVASRGENRTPQGRPLELAQPGGSIFAALSPVHALSGLVAVVLMGIGLAAIVYRAAGRLAALEPSSALMVIVYVAGIALVYAQSKP